MNKILLAVMAAVPFAFLGGYLAGRVPSPTAPAVATPPDAGRTSLFYFSHREAEASVGGKQAARAVERCVGGDRIACEEALGLYRQLEPVENFGREYPSLRWTCAYVLADDAARAELLRDPDAARYVRLLEPDNWSALRNWLTTRYELGGGAGGAFLPPSGGMPGMQPLLPPLPGSAPMPGPGGLGSGASFRWVDEFVRFNSPGRAEWERSDDVVSLVDPQPGQVIADIGAGPGFYAFRFSPRVGPTGKVFAVELDRGHLDYLRQVKHEENLANLEVVEGTAAGTGLPADSVDVVFLCATYQAIYGSTREADRSAWLASLKATLRAGGRVVISENVPDGELAAGVLPDDGISVSRGLVVAQLEAYGFRLVREERFIPQRYLLVFEET